MRKTYTLTVCFLVAGFALCLGHAYAGDGDNCDRIKKLLKDEETRLTKKIEGVDTLQSSKVDGALRSLEADLASTQSAMELIESEPQICADPKASKNELLRERQELLEAEAQCKAFEDAARRVSAQLPSFANMDTPAQEKQFLHEQQEAIRRLQEAAKNAFSDQKRKDLKEIEVELQEFSALDRLGLSS